MKGLVEDGTTVNCRDCVYVKNCNVASAHKYRVGACRQFDPKPDPDDVNTPWPPFTAFLLGVVRDGYTVKFYFDAPSHALSIECATTTRGAGNKWVKKLIAERYFRETHDPDFIAKVAIGQMKGELKE